MSSGRVKRHGNTLAFVRTQFYTDDKTPIAWAKTTHYIASHRPHTGVQEM
jgi:acyl-coenzyme A thioesterase PaaI-like protein